MSTDFLCGFGAGVGTGLVPMGVLQSGGTVLSPPQADGLAPSFLCPQL